MVQCRHDRKLAWLPLVSSLVVVCLLGVVGCSRAPALSPTPVVPVTSGSPPLLGANPATPSAPIPTSQPATSTPVPKVAVATDLAQMTTDGKVLAATGWTMGGVVLSFRAPSPAGPSLVPQVEVVKSDQPFTGAPTTQGPPVPTTNAEVDARVTLGNLVPGQYKWQARFEDAETKQLGAWSGFANGDVAFGIVGPAPSIQNLTVSGTEHNSGGVALVSQKDQPVLQWSVTIDQSLALDHLVYVADQQAKAATVPPTGNLIADDSRSLPIDNLSDGDWYLHLWAVDKAGQASQPATVEVQVMRHPLEISNVLFRSWATNPLYQTVSIQFDASRDARVTVSILPLTSAAPIRVYDVGAQSASKAVHLTWDGKDSQGKVVAPGTYRFLIDAVDQAGNDAQALYSGITITDKVIKVSLGTQSLTAYEGDKPLVTTLVTSGGSDIPTPVGQFEILQKSSPFMFHSPFPKGNKFWYPDVQSHFAMLFDQPDADFIHDAPWRNKFGPGTNGPGIPGQVYTGSHGCVETPASVMPRLYPWTPLGTPVIVSQ